MARTKETTVTVDNKIVKDSSITKIFNTVSKKLIKIGVPIPVKDIKKVGELKTRSKRVRGVTYTFKRIAYNNINIGKTNYIGINKKLIDEDFEIEKTMAHELIHTIPGCSNHGPNFKRYAELINRHYPEYNVSTYYTPDSAEIENIANIKKPKYVVTCENCGVKTYFYRKCKTLDIISRCTCKKCKSSNFKVESLV
jgi:hypothetical protein